MTGEGFDEVDACLWQANEAGVSAQVVTKRPDDDDERSFVEVEMSDEAQLSDVLEVLQCGGFLYSEEASIAVGSKGSSPLPSLRFVAVRSNFITFEDMNAAP